MKFYTNDLLNKSFQALSLKVLGTFFAFLLSLKIANLLAPSDLGLYFLALMVLTIGSVLSRMGMENVILRLISENKSEQKLGDLKGVFWSGLVTAFFVSLLLTLFVYCIAPMLSSSLFKTVALEQDIQIMALGIMPFTMVALVVASLKGLQHIAWAQMLESLLVPLFAFLFIWLLVEKNELMKIEFFYVCALTLTAGCSFFIWKKVTQPFAEKTTYFSKKVLLSQGRPLLLVSSFNLIMVWIGIIALGVFSSTDEVAIYGIATRVAVLTSFILIAVNSASSAKFASLYKQNKMLELQKMGFHSTLLITFFSMPVLFMFFFFPDLVISFFGEAYADAEIVLSVLAVGQMLTVLTGSIGQLLVMTGHGKELRNCMFFGVLVQCLLAFLLVPDFGAVGAAISAATCSAVINISAAIYVRKVLAIKTTLMGI